MEQQNEKSIRIENERGETWEEALTRLHNTPAVGNLLPKDDNINIGTWGREAWENAKSIPAPIYNMSDIKKQSNTNNRNRRRFKNL